jgi:hypothetical protein
MRMAERVLTFASSLVFISVTLIAAASAASGTVSALGKPVIAKPATVPAQPLAGKGFSVSFRVTRGGSGDAPLMAGKMISDPSIDGRAIQHTQSFRSGTARATFVVPANAAGRLLKMKLTIRAGTQSATKVGDLPCPRSVEAVVVHRGGLSRGRKHGHNDALVSGHVVDCGDPGRLGPLRDRGWDSDRAV